MFFTAFDINYWATPLCYENVFTPSSVGVIVTKLVNYKYLAVGTQNIYSMNTLLKLFYKSIEEN